MSTCFNCEKKHHNQSVVHMCMETYCTKCIQDSMSPSKNGGLPSINYHFYHYVDQWYLDSEIKWSSNRRKNKKQLKKLFRQLRSRA